jgi:hypothetical protein
MGIARRCTWQGRCLREEGMINGEQRKWMERIWRERAKAIRVNECITEAEVVEAIKSMKRRKAADVLGLRAELLQAGVEELILTLTVLFNKMWRSGEFPKEWNEGVLIPIRWIRKETWENVQTIGLSLLGQLWGSYTMRSWCGDVLRHALSTSGVLNTHF